jgi:ferritin-like metal-binding protein YciE
MNTKAIEKIYVKKLKEIFTIEKKVLEILPKVIRMTTNKDLKIILRNHLEQTEFHTGRILKIFQHFNHYKAGGKNSDSIEVLINEMEVLISEITYSDTFDAEIILIFQKIEHLEIACYSSLVIYARILGHGQAGEMLQESLDEEFEADNKLDRLNEEIISQSLMKHA